MPRKKKAAKAKATKAAGPIKPQALNEAIKSAKRQKPSGKIKALTCKFSKTQDAVTVKGLGPTEDCPKAIKNVLTRYGFEATDERGVTWTSLIKPQLAADLEDTIMRMACIVDVRIDALQRNGKHSGSWLAEIEGGGPQRRSGDPVKALTRTYKEWNKAGRQIDNVALEAALEKPTEQVNATRG